ncbi:uncharacterized protein TNCV_2257301 [Trichonephila clavipes]|nr:uncharacterized protein TNCV_2257301 [Trichonephila clavipes]
MEHELAFTLHLAMYQEAHLGDYITFMMNFRGVLIHLKPSEVIELETVYAVKIINLMMEIVPYHDPMTCLGLKVFPISNLMTGTVNLWSKRLPKWKGVFVQALWTQYAILKLYFLVYKPWRRYGAQNLTSWTRLAQAVLDRCFVQKWPDCVFQVPDSCSICLSTMHWPEKTQCVHAFHLRCFLRHLDVSNTCPVCRTSDPLSLAKVVPCAIKINNRHHHHEPQILWSRLIQFKCVPEDLFHDYMEQEARKGKGSFIQAMWTVIGKPKSYNLLTKAWTEQILSPWIYLSQMVFRHLHQYSNDTVCCPECLEPMTLGHFYYKHAPKTHTLDSRKQCIFWFGRRQWNRGEKNLSVNVNHIVSCLKLFVTNEKDFSAIVEAKEEDIAEKIEVEKCECQHFQSNPRDKAGRRKLNSVGFYDAMYEKPEMWEEGIEFHGGLGKDVWGIVERYLKGDLEWIHISVKHDVFDISYNVSESTEIVVRQGRDSRQFEESGTMVPFSHQSTLASTQYCLSLHSVSRKNRKIALGAGGQ